MAKLVLSDLDNLENESSATGAINTNNATLEEIMDKAVFRTGESPNHMLAELDMNSNKIINLPQAVDPSDPVRVQDLPSLVPDFEAGQVAVEDAEAAAQAAQNAAAQAINAANSIVVGTLGTQNANAVSITGGSITGLSNPVANTDASTKHYSDLQNPENARVLVRVATTTTLPNSPTFTAETSSTLKTLEATTNGSLVIDGVTVSDGDRVLVKDQATALHNDVYTKSTVGSHYKLTQSSELDANLKGEAFYVNEGSTNAGKTFTRTDTTPNFYADTVMLFSNSDFATSGQLDVTNRNVSSNTSSIATNTANIATNTAAISTLQSNSSGFITASSINTLSNKTISSANNTISIGTANVSGLAASATTDTTNASNISSGTLAKARLPSLSSSDISGLAASATTDTTNASNISSGTLPDARLSNVISASSAGDSTHIPVIAWDAHGRITSVSTAVAASSSFTTGIVAPGVNGIVGDGVDTGDKADIDTVISASGVINFYPGTYLIDVDATWPAGKTYVIHKGALIKVSTGKTLTINGIVSAGAYKIFGKTSTTVLDLDGTVAQIASVRPEWWGCYRNNSNDDFASINAAIICAQARTTTSDQTILELNLSGGNYAVGSTVTFDIGNGKHWKIHGVASEAEGSYATVIAAKSTCSGAAVKLDGHGTGIGDVEVYDLAIDNQDYTAGPNFGLWIINCTGGFKRSRVHDIFIRNFQRGLQLEDARMFIFENIAIWNQNDDTPNGGPMGIWMTASTNNFVGDTEFLNCQVVSGSQLSVKGTANAGGLVRLTLGSTSSLSNGQSVNVSGVGGTTEANGTWNITVIDGTHIDLQGSSFAHAWTSGGNVDGGTSQGRCVSMNLTNSGSYCAGVRFTGCIFYFGLLCVDMEAGAANCTISDIWFNPGCQLEGHNANNADAFTISAYASGATCNDIHIRGLYIVGGGWKRALVLNSSGSSSVYAIHFCDNFMNHMKIETMDIRGTGGDMYGISIQGNIIRDSNFGGGSHDCIYVENVSHITVNNNTLCGSGYSVNHIVYFNSGGLYQVAVGNNSAGRCTSSPVVDTSGARTGQLFSGLNV